MTEELPQKRSIAYSLFKQRHGTPIWDSVLRLTGVVALLAIPLTIYVPRSGGLVGFGILTVWVNGPISPFLPSTYEPMLMLVGRVYSPLLVAIVGVIGTLYVEYLNYQLFKRVLQSSSLERMRKGRTVTWVLKWFNKVPFLTIWISSWSIVPYWPVRFISPLAGYDVRRHLLATFLGRFPRLWFFAALGVWWNASMGVLALISMSSIFLGLGIFLYKRARGKRSSQPTAKESPSGSREELAPVKVAEG